MEKFIRFGIDECLEKIIERFQTLPAPNKACTDEVGSQGCG
jgi:hypothetical protein